MSEPSEILCALEQRFAEHLLALVLLDKAWPQGLTATEPAKVGRLRNVVLVKIEALQERITSNRAETLADAAVQLRRLAAMTEAENGAGLRSVMSSPDEAAPKRRLAT